MGNTAVLNLPLKTFLEAYHDLEPDLQTWVEASRVATAVLPRHDQLLETRMVVEANPEAIVLHPSLDLLPGALKWVELTREVTTRLLLHDLALELQRHLAWIPVATALTLSHDQEREAGTCRAVDLEYMVLLPARDLGLEVVTCPELLRRLLLAVCLLSLRWAILPG